MNFLLGWPNFRGHVSFTEGNDPSGCLTSSRSVCQVLPPCRAENSDSGNMDCHLVDLVRCDWDTACTKKPRAGKLVPSTVGLHPFKIKMEPKDDDLESGR